MTPLDPTTIRESFRLIRSQTPPIIHELVDTLESRLLLDESMLKMQARIDDVCERIFSSPHGDTASNVHPFPGHSVRVPSAWEQDARSVSLPDVGGLTLGDPRIDTLREEGLA